MFTQEQLSAFFHATYLFTSTLHVAVILDIEQLYNDILATLPIDPTTSCHLSTLLSTPSNSVPDPYWSVDSKGFLHLDNHIYISSSNNLHLCVLQYKYDHVLSRYYSQNKIIDLIYQKYPWSSLRDYIKDYYKSCTICMCIKR